MYAVPAKPEPACIIIIRWNDPPVVGPCDTRAVKADSPTRAVLSAPKPMDAIEEDISISKKSTSDALYGVCPHEEKT